MWRLWPLLRRLWAAVGTVAAGLAVKDLFAVWTKQSVPDVERFSRFPLGHWYWAGGGLTLFAIISVVAARAHRRHKAPRFIGVAAGRRAQDRKSTRLNSSHVEISYAVFCLKKKNKKPIVLLMSKKKKNKKKH